MERLQKTARAAGIKQVRKAVLAKNAEIVYLAKDCEPHILEGLELLCKDNGVSVAYAETMKELARACRIDVPTAAAVILKQK